MRRHIISTLDFASFYQPVSNVTHTCARLGIIADQDTLLKSFKRKFEVGTLCLERDLSDVSVKRRESVHLRKAFVQRRAKSRFFATLVRNPFTSNKIGRRWIFAIEHQLNRFAQHACEANLEEYVRKGFRRSAI